MADTDNIQWRRLRLYHTMRGGVGGLLSVGMVAVCGRQRLGSELMLMLMYEDGKWRGPTMFVDSFFWNVVVLFSTVVRTGVTGPGGHSALWVTDQLAYE